MPSRSAVAAVTTNVLASCAGAAASATTRIAGEGAATSCVVRRRDIVVGLGAAEAAELGAVPAYSGTSSTRPRRSAGRDELARSEVERPADRETGRLERLAVDLGEHALSAKSNEPTVMASSSRVLGEPA